MKSKLPYIVTALLTSTPVVTLAQGSVPLYRPIVGVTDVNTFNALVVKTANFAGGILLGISVIMIMISAYYFLTAGGSEDSIKTARTYLIYALVGIVVALLAFALPTLVANFISP